MLQYATTRAVGPQQLSTKKSTPTIGFSRADRDSSKKVPVLHDRPCVVYRMHHSHMRVKPQTRNSLCVLECYKNQLCFEMLLSQRASAASMPSGFKQSQPLL